MVERQPEAHEDNSDYLGEDNLQLRNDLNEESVANYLKMISRTNPQQLPTALQAVREMWAYTVGGICERYRLEYVNTVLLQLQVSDEILTVCLSMDTKWHSHREDRIRQRATADAGVYELEADALAAELRARIAKAQADQAESSKKIRDFEKPVPPKTDEGEARRQGNWKKADLEVQRLEKRRVEVLAAYGPFDALSPKLQEEYVADENMYNQRIREAKERRMQYE